MWSFGVPNAPCGVESKPRTMLILTPHHERFLMHRVELKVLIDFLGIAVVYIVPNAPCGVESTGK